MAASKHAIKSAVVIIAFLLVPASGFIYSEEITPDTAGAAAEQNDEKPDAKTAKRFFLPPLEIIGVNNAFTTINKHVFQDPNGQVDGESIAENLHSRWAWDQDWLLVNQFGHPYQGSLYYNAARANGFNFYASAAFTLAGSTLWELLGETTAPSMNDRISTTLGGAAFGEMLHRLYLETPSPPAVLVSPMDALNSAITKKHPKRGNDRIHRLATSFGAGWSNAAYFSPEKQSQPYFSVPVLDAAVAVIYGSPFERARKTPYEHFELNLGVAAGMDFAKYNLALSSDGYVFSFAPLAAEKQKATTGLTIHYDYFDSNVLGLFSYALDWTVKYQRVLNALRLETKAHAGWTVFGGSFFLNPATLPRQRGIADFFFGDSRATGEAECAAYNNFGTGINAKLAFSLTSLPFGQFEFGAKMYKLFNIAYNVPETAGNELYCFLESSYWFPVGTQTTIGINGSFSIKSSNLTVMEHIRSRDGTVSVCVKRFLISK
jgi:hypothetical protein